MPNEHLGLLRLYQEDALGFSTNMKPEIDDVIHNNELPVTKQMLTASRWDGGSIRPVSLTIFAVSKSRVVTSPKISKQEALGESATQYHHRRDRICVLYRWSVVRLELMFAVFVARLIQFVQGYPTLRNARKVF